MNSDFESRTEELREEIVCEEIKKLESAEVGKTWRSAIIDYQSP
jgi:hypothetical protein